MKSLFPLLLAASVAVPLLFSRAQQKQQPVDPPRPLKALLIAGGCCHDYVGQHKALYEGIQARANVRVDVMWTRDKSTNPPLPLFDDPDWAKGYDVIIHDECAAANRDPKVLKNILAAHQKIPAVHLHCAMHSFRQGNDLWFKHLGLQSTGHGPQEPIAIRFTDPEHPITRTLKDWTTGKEELYNNAELFDAEPLALGTQKFERGGKQNEQTAVVAWTNTKQGAPSFSTTIGHNTFTVEDPRYLDLVTRGLLWAAGKLDGDYLKPYTGSNLVTEMKGKAAPEQKSIFGEAPKGAIKVKLSAKTTQTGERRFTWCAIDGDEESRWCGASSAMPNWLQLEFEKPTTVTRAQILWEKRDQWYQYKIETSMDGKTWKVAHDASENTKGGDTDDQFLAEGVKFLRVFITKQQTGMWPSLWELKLSGKDGPLKLFPVLGKKEASQVQVNSGAGYEKSGNVPPRIVEMTPAEEAEILKDAGVPEGFDMTLFAPWQTANYPVYVAAAPNGDLYVSSDGNGSLGRDPNRGRILRLRDLDRDGRADEVIEFVRDVDSPRGLIWDHDRLYLLHPPHISVFFDRDHDGIAEESKRLISDIAFGFKDRPADHTTNGLELGIDGWIYIAVGDFGFMKAKGTDGRELQLRGGGVVRFRPDGSRLELFAEGTRNILGTPLSPTLDMFARDNTNDGGGWDVRFHHFTGLEDHGYPRLYKHWDKEIVAPLADYGGGSGCGSVYIHEPGFPSEWNQAPFTCDWGRGGSFRHSVEPLGATFRETVAPEKFIRMTRPTDADVDGMSAVYQASWRGKATFGWAGPDTGYIVRVTPSGHQAQALPDFEKMDSAALVEALDSPSHVRTLAAQRALLRRGDDQGTIAALRELAGAKDQPLRARIAALYAVVQLGPGSGLGVLEANAGDPMIAPFVMRAAGDLDLSEISSAKASVEKMLDVGLRKGSPRTKVEAAVAAARLDLKKNAPAIAELFLNDDPVIVHTAYRGLAKMGAHEAAFAHIASDDINIRKGAAWALMRIHEKEVIDGLLERLEGESDIAKRRPLLSILCRLYHREAEWTGNSWGTRPDTRGPYYQLATWEQSERILGSIRQLLNEAPAEEAAFILKKINKNRIPFDGGLDRLVDLALKNDALIPVALAQIAAAGDVPAKALPLVIKGASDPKTPPAGLADAIKVLLRSDDARALPASLKALVALSANKEAGKERAVARREFLAAPKLENHHLALEAIAAGASVAPEAYWARLAVLQLASRKSGSPESQQMSLAAIDRAWAVPALRLAFIKSAAELRNPVINDRIRVALSDPDQAVAKAAKDASGRLKIQLPGADKTPKIATLKVPDAIKQAVAHRGDVALGQAIYARATCSACHTVTQDGAQKGPYLGNIAETYRRPDLAASILDPNRTIAQGFATNLFTLKDGTKQMGFVTNEADEKVVIRDITSAEHTLKKADIKERDTLPTSLMPPGLMSGFTVHEFASLLDYLESLAKEKAKGKK